MADSVMVERSMRAAPAVVATLVSDVTRMGEWSPEATGGRWTKGSSGVAVGATFEGDNRNGSKSWSTTCTVTHWEPDSEFGFRVSAGPMQVADWHYRFTPTGEGCLVTETWTDRRNAFIKLLGKPFSGVADRATHNRATMEQTLERLGAAAEAQPT
jgi:hypothetical protein